MSFQFAFNHAGTKTGAGDHHDNSRKNCRPFRPRRAGGERSGDAEVYKYIFVDGSVLTVAHDVWDFGYEECMCWHGAGHDPENCTATRMCDTFHLRGNE